MRIRPLLVFYLIVILLFAFDYSMWKRHQKVNRLSSLIKGASVQLVNIYEGNSINPLSRSLRAKVNNAHEQLKSLAKPWPIRNHSLNQLLLKVFFWVLIPVLMLWLLWLHFKSVTQKKE
jgi:hypothetical protein